MEPKKYSSYAEIDRELEILKVQKDINYHKLKLSFEKTKENITPYKIVNGFVSSYTNYFSNSYTTILQTFLPYAIGWFLNKKKR